MVTNEAGALMVESDDAPDQELDVDHHCINVMLYLNEKTGEMTMDREAYFHGKAYEEVGQQSYIGTIELIAKPESDLTRLKATYA
ncbi:hypothetical protein EVAR_43111_1 [Eumeta japonica]|uniref:Uncharacterized protein n=1 Tax=Eumeta variegata TaxID=151549 RepID=A0A4C1YF90_EUMVA|nr:hypothetical protein EVAR_43111_1 [Eumeta japonica]